MKVSRVLAMMLCIMIMANCLVVAAAASGSENVGGGYWAWETKLLQQPHGAFWELAAFGGAITRNLIF